MGDILQPTHLLFVLVVALLVLGPKRLPEAGRALGRGLRDFRSAISGEETPEHTISPPQPPVSSDHPAPTGEQPSQTADQPAPASDHPSPEPSETAETEVQAPGESEEPVASSASADSRT